MDSLGKRFVHSNVQGYFLAPLMVEVGRGFNMRLDIVNVAKSPGVLVRVESVVPADFKVTTTQPHYNIQNGSIEFEKKMINPFTDEAITFALQATKAGVFNLNSQLIYIDDLGETKTCKIKPVNITVQPASNNPDVKTQ